MIDVGLIWYQTRPDHIMIGDVRMYIEGGVLFDILPFPCVPRRNEYITSNGLRLKVIDVEYCEVDHDCVGVNVMVDIID